jgi:hypothetical protein
MVTPTTTWLKYQFWVVALALSSTKGDLISSAEVTKLNNEPTEGSSKCEFRAGGARALRGSESNIIASFECFSPLYGANWPHDC